MFCFTTKKTLSVFYGVEMMLLGRLRCRRRWRQRERQKGNGLRLAKQQLYQVQHTCWCISLLALNLYDVRLPNLTRTSTTEKNRRRLSLFFLFCSVCWTWIYLLRIQLPEVSSLFDWGLVLTYFFSPFSKKNKRIYIAYSNSFHPPPLSQSRRRFRFPLVKR